MGREERLLDDMKAAMKSGDKHTLETIRLLRSALKNASIAKGKDISDEDVIEVLSKEAKKRKESLEIFKKGGREDLAKKEAREKIIARAIAEMGAESLREIGKIRGLVVPQVKGCVEGKEVQEMVSGKLS